MAFLAKIQERFLIYIYTFTVYVIYTFLMRS